jgi:hypothetical protein
VRPDVIWQDRRRASKSAGSITDISPGNPTRGIVGRIVETRKNSQIPVGGKKRLTRLLYAIIIGLIVAIGE